MISRLTLVSRMTEEQNSICWELLNSHNNWVLVWIYVFSNYLHSAVSLYSLHAATIPRDFRMLKSDRKRLASVQVVCYYLHVLDLDQTHNAKFLRALLRKEVLNNWISMTLCWKCILMPAILQLPFMNYCSSILFSTINW